MNREFGDGVELAIDEAKALLLAGDAALAASRLATPFELAVAAGRDQDAERLRLNMISLQLEVSPRSAPVAELRQVLSTSRIPLHRYLAAHILARHYSNGRKLPHIAFYARTALALAPEAHRSTANYQLGLYLLALSEPGQGLRHLLAASEGSTPAAGPVSMLWAVQAYAQAVSGERSRALHLADISLKRGTEFAVYGAAVDFCLGFVQLELGELERATELGHHALGLCHGPTSGDSRAALFLVAESLMRQGKRDEAAHYFDQLCRRFYPSLPPPAVLLTLRAAPLINWMV